MKPTKSFVPWSLLLTLGCGPMLGSETSPEGGAGDPGSVTRSDLTLGGEADTFVRSGSYANTSYGSRAEVQVDSSEGGTQMRGYLRFRPGAVGSITRATLRLFVRDGSPDSGDIVSVASSSWTEGMTWNTQPALGGVVAALGTTRAGAWIEKDVTEAVKGQAVVSFAVLPRSSDQFAFASREATNKPQLVVVQDAPPTVSFTTPTNGATVSGVLIEANQNCLVAAGDDKGVVKVEFFRDGAPLNTQTAAPYSCNWDTRTAADGSTHTLRAVAFDTAGQTASAQVTVTVQNRNTAPPGELLWTGDAENPTYQDWSDIFTRAPFCGATPQNGIPPNDHGGYHARVTSNPAPLQGTYTYRIKVDDTIDCWQERTELSQGGSNNPKQYRPGDENWEAFGIWLGGDYQSGADCQGARTLFQHKPIPSDNPTTSLKACNNNWQWVTQGGPASNPDKDTVTIGPAPKQVWCRFLVHTRYSRTSNGLNELYSDVPNGCNGVLKLMGRQVKPTLFDNTTAIRVNWGLYREDASNAGTETFANDGFAVGTTAQVVTKHAFGVAFTP